MYLYRHIYVNIYIHIFSTVCLVMLCMYLYRHTYLNICIYLVPCVSSCCPGVSSWCVSRHLMLCCVSRYVTLFVLSRVSRHVVYVSIQTYICEYTHVFKTMRLVMMYMYLYRHVYVSIYMYFSTMCLVTTSGCHVILCVSSRHVVCFVTSCSVSRHVVLHVLLQGGEDS